MTCRVSSQTFLVPNPLFFATLTYSTAALQKTLHGPLFVFNVLCAWSTGDYSCSLHTMLTLRTLVIHAILDNRRPIFRAVYQEQSQIWFWKTRRVSMLILIVPPGTRGRPATPEMVTVWSGSTFPNIGMAPQNVISYLTGRKPA